MNYPVKYFNENDWYRRHSFFSFIIGIIIGLLFCASCGKDTQPTTQESSQKTPEPTPLDERAKSDSKEAVILATQNILDEFNVKNLVEVAGSIPLICGSFKAEKNYVLNYSGDAVKECGNVEYQSKMFFDIKRGDVPLPNDFALVMLDINLHHSLLPREAEILSDLVEKAKVIVIDSPRNVHRQNDQALDVVELAKTKGRNVYIDVRITNRRNDNADVRHFTVIK